MLDRAKEAVDEASRDQKAMMLADLIFQSRNARAQADLVMIANNETLADAARPYVVRETGLAMADIAEPAMDGKGAKLVKRKVLTYEQRESELVEILEGLWTRAEPIRSRVEDLLDLIELKAKREYEAKLNSTETAD